MRPALFAHIWLWIACYGENAATQQTLPPAPLTHDAFLWQRRWTPEVYAALQQPPAGLRRIVMLAAEVEWEGDQPVIRPAGIDWGWLAARPDTPGANTCGLAIRVGLPKRADPDVPDAQTDPLQPRLRDATLAALASVRSAAEAAAFSPCELHLDLDMPTARLAGYAAWLPEFRAAWPAAPLTVTGLPDWLRPEARPGLLALLAAVDGWILQVHWLRKTSTGYALIDEAEARRAAQIAAALPAPVRLALPTYAQPTPQGELRPDPDLLARLLAWDSPPRPTGIIWFRLPLPGDPDTLPTPALAALIAGRAPRYAAAAEAISVSPGLWDLALTNTGEDLLTDTCLSLSLPPGAPAQIELLGRDTPPTARSPDRSTHYPLALPSPLLSGERRIVGWLRLGPDADTPQVQAIGLCP